MAKRFGRNQRRKLMQRIAEVEQDADLSHGAVCAMREWTQTGLGINCTFVDDEMRLIVGLAQRAILAGLASDCDQATQRRFIEAAEKHREGHERNLGRPI